MSKNLKYRSAEEPKLPSRLCAPNDLVYCLTPYRYEVDRAKGPLRRDFPRQCKSELTDDYVVGYNACDDQCVLRMWRVEVDARKQWLFRDRRCNTIRDEVRLEREINIKIRKEALRHLFAKEQVEQEKELNKVGLSFYKQLYD